METTEAVRYLAAVGFVLALVGGATFMVRRFGLPGVMGGASRRLQVVETLMLGGRHKLVLVRCDRTEHLIAITPQATTLVNTLNTAPIAQNQPAPAEAI
jgi:flagellar biosynthetic protein FliO